ncbi:AI-2E family transporter, partial [Paeniglutamicibacter kerguelensis]
MTTHDGDEAKGPAVPPNGPNDSTDATPEIPGKLTDNPTQSGTQAGDGAASTAPWWRRVIGRAQHTLDSRIKPPENFGFPPDPGHELGEPEPETLNGSRSHPVAFGFLFTVGVGLALLGFFLLTNVGSLMIWISIALFIALGLDPVVRYFVGRGLSRIAAVLITMALLLGVAGGFI